MGAQGTRVQDTSSTTQENPTHAPTATSSRLPLLSLPFYPQGKNKFTMLAFTAINHDFQCKTKSQQDVI
eukprot:7906429-Ditylum_brightwellii.AAC.1